MDKKVLIALVEEIVTAVAAKHSLEDVEARAMVGIALKKNRTAFENAVVLPTLTLATTPVVA